LFELTGDVTSDDHPSPWLLVAPTLVADLNGPVLEHVLMARDEGANLAWAIERIVEGPLGRGVDRAQAWHAAFPAPPVAPAPAGEPAPARYGEQSWRYRLETTTPPWWIPLVAERISATSEQVRLRRARMQAWDLVDAGAARAQIGPQSVILDPR